MRFSLHPDLFETFPGLVIAGVVARGIDNQTPHRTAMVRWEERWREAAQHVDEFGNAQSHPRIIPWRERMRAAGAPPKKFPSSIEALLRRASKGGEPFAINPLVDTYNSVSLHHVVPAGGFDLDALPGDLELRRSREGDRFTALGEETPLAVPAGEISYAAGSTILTRHFVWRQSGQGAIAPETRRVVLLSELLGDVVRESPTLADDILADFRAVLSDGFGVEVEPFMLDTSRLETSLD